MALDGSPKVKFWTKRHGLRLRYRFRNRRRRYIPDILVEYHDGRTFLEEVKGYVYSPGKFIMKNGAAKLYCAARGWTYRVVWRGGLEAVE